MLNSQPLGFYAPAQLIDDARRHDVPVRAIDVNASQWDCTLEPSRDGRVALRLGLRLVHRLSQAAVEPLLEARRAAPFRSCRDLRHRVHLPRATWERLLEAGTLDAIEPDRRRAWWEMLEGDPATDLPLWGSSVEQDTMPHVVRPLDATERILNDYRATGFSLRGHPMESVREGLRSRGVVCARELKRFSSGEVVRVAGLVLLRQRPSTARGITFVTLEDETGTVNLVVHQTTWDRFREVARTAPVWLARGKIETEAGVIHVVAFQLQDLARHLGDLRARSRDFR
ncbi:MAG TPA: hypothetical protein ENJ50_11065 [Planctomycetaceae bacterium]|nr:hypothetical protein [Planctomycetaceae bacterium]